MNIIAIVIAFILGLAMSSLFYFVTWYYHFSDYGGTIMIDTNTGVYRYMINDNYEDWVEQKYVIFKIAKAEKTLKRLKDIDDMSLEKEKCEN